jgi:hypothetical protein
VSEYSIKTCHIQAGWFSSIPSSRKIIFAHNGPYTQHGVLPVSLSIATQDEKHTIARYLQFHLSINFEGVFSPRQIQQFYERLKGF